MGSPSAYRASDALDLLQRDHELVRKLLRDYDRLRQGGGGGPEGKADIVEKLCDALTLCAQIEEELLYPLVLPVLDGQIGPAKPPPSRLRISVAPRLCGRSEAPVTATEPG